MATELENLTEQIDEGIRSGKYTWREIQEAIVHKTKEAAVTTDAYVHENPWKVVGIAAALGMIVGMLFAPSSED